LHFLEVVGRKSDKKGESSWIARGIDVLFFHLPHLRREILLICFAGLSFEWVIL
jgi:hypothetical protein